MLDKEKNEESQEEIKAQKNRLHMRMVQMLPDENYFFRALAYQLEGDR